MMLRYCCVLRIHPILYRPFSFAIQSRKYSTGIFNTHNTPDIIHVSVKKTFHIKRTAQPHIHAKCAHRVRRDGATAMNKMKRQPLKFKTAPSMSGKLWQARSCVTCTRHKSKKNGESHQPKRL